MLQLYVAVEPKDVPSSSTIPFGGLSRGPQSMAGEEREGGGRRGGRGEEMHIQWCLVVLQPRR